ncbi:MAG: DUF4398 domain-containing protein, partial [Steroidobacteraceae bacterium]
MKYARQMLFALVSWVLVSPLPLAAQQVERDVTFLSDEVAGRLEGYSFQEGPESDLVFRGTPIALGAEGEAEVEFQDGRTRVDVSVEGLPDPASLGPFSTYVLWAVTADGHANNIGSIDVEDGDGSLETTTALSQFALIVSAEPHFAVNAPSRAIVLQNLGRKVKGQKITITGLKERMDYSSLAPEPPEAADESLPELLQARYALAIAEVADADRLAPREFAEARQLLDRAEAAQADKKYSVRSTAPRLARDAVQK